MPPSDASLTIRLPADLKDAILRVAEDTHRSAGKLITMVMSEYLEGLGEYTPKRTRPARRTRRR